MTDKQIIINDKKKTIHRLQDECTEKTNAIIALGEQLDQLKFDYAELEKRHNDSFEQFKQLKSELTRANCQIADDEILQCDMREAIEELKAENKHLNDLLNQALKELEKTRETLTEIKEIVGIGLVDGLQPGEYSGFLKILQAQILQKISECEVVDEL